MMSFKVSHPKASMSVRFDTTEVVSLLVVGFCATMLAVGKAEAVYLPVIAGVVGYWMPRPCKKKKSEQPAESVASVCGGQAMTRPSDNESAAG